MAKILIVDDEAATVDMLSTYLSMMGHEPLGALSGGDGLILVEVESPDLLILDLMMPDVDGFQVCEQVRSNPESQNLPILIISARTDQIAKDKAKSLGANFYLTKPIDLKKLTNHIQELSLA